MSRSNSLPWKTIFYRLLGINRKRVTAIFFRYFYILRKGSHQLSDLFFWPFIDILLWGLTSTWVAVNQPGSSIPLFLMTGLIFWQVTWRGSIDISTTLLQEFWSRNLINLFASPLKISEWILGVSLFCIVKLFITVSFGAVVVYFLYTLNIFAVGWMFLPFAVLLLMFGWTVGYLAASAIIYWGHRVEALAFMVGYIFAPFSAVFYPVSILPLWAQKIAWCLPTTYLFEGMRSILSQHVFPVHYFWMSLAISITYLLFAMGLFKFSFEKSKEKGLSRLD